MSSHTPSPLSFAVETQEGGHFDGEDQIIIRRADGAPIAMVFKGNAVWLGGGEAEATTRLWCAADALYTALAELVEQHRQVAHGERTHITASALSAAETALRQAEGL